MSVIVLLDANCMQSESQMGSVYKLMFKMLLCAGNTALDIEIQQSVCVFGC